MTETLTIFNFGTGEKVPATQADIDDLQAYVMSFSKRPEIDKEESKHTDALKFRLACYVNKMRSDMLFIAEEKEIEPYKGIRNIDGGLCYPSVPNTKYCLPVGVAPEFAREIVKRWNSYGK